MNPRLRWPSLAAAALAVALVGCAPEPAAEPTTGFANEAEAFAAAEETYRAYVDALNQVDLSDPETFEAVYAWTTGDANAGERKSLTQMHADNWSVDGNTVVDAFHGVEYDLPNGQVTVDALVCSDVSGVTVVDSSGMSMVGGERQDVYALEVVFRATEITPTGLSIMSSTAVEDSRCD